MAPERTPEEKAMILSGVGRRYVRMTMAEHAPKSTPLRDFVGRSEFKPELLQGRGAILTGDMPFTDTMLHLSARSALQRGVNAVVIDLVDFYKYEIERHASSEEVERIERASVLCIPSFCLRDYPENPFEGRQKFQMERALTTYLDEQRALIVAADAPLTHWWSPAFVKAIKASATEIIL